MARDVFISYSSRDAATAETICSLLEKRGVACWIAPRDVLPGRNYDEEIVSGIEGTKAIVVLLSDSSNESPHVKRELELALNNGSAIIPIRIQNTVPGRGLKYFLAGRQWVDAWQPPIENRMDDVAAAIRALASAEAGAERAAPPDELPSSSPPAAPGPSQGHGSPIGTSPGLQAHDDWVAGVAVSPDGRTLATGGRDKWLRLWDIGERVTLHHSFRYDPPPVGHAYLKAGGDIRFSPDGSRLVTLSQLGDDDTGLLSFYSVGDRQLLASRPYGWYRNSPQAHPGDMVFSADGRLMAVTSLGASQLPGIEGIPVPNVGIWSTHDGRQVLRIEGTSRCLGIAPGGERIAVLGYEIADLTAAEQETRQNPRPCIRIHAVPSGTKITSVPLPWRDLKPRQCRLTGDWSTLVVKSLDGTISVMSFPEWRAGPRHQGLPVDEYGMDRTCMSVLGEGGQVIFWSHLKGKAEVFSLLDSSNGARIPIHEPAINPRPVIVAPDSAHLTVLSWKGMPSVEPYPPEDFWLRTFSVPSGELQVKLPLENQTLGGAYAPDGIHFYTGDVKGKVLRWDLRRGVLDCEVTR
jgi:WD40 repeat protein